MSDLLSGSIGYLAGKTIEQNQQQQAEAYPPQNQPYQLPTRSTGHLLSRQHRRIKFLLRRCRTAILANLSGDGTDV